MKRFESSPHGDLMFDISETENTVTENETVEKENNVTGNGTDKKQTTINIKTRSGRTVKGAERFNDYV